MASGHYQRRIDPGDSAEDAPPVAIVETDIDLYYHMAVEMYREILANNQAGRHTVFITPVGPVFQYRRFVYLCRELPIDLSHVYWFFMDEYLADAGSTPDRLIDLDSPLSFRGFVMRELVEPLLEFAEGFRVDREQVFFPDPADPEAYDRRLDDLGGADVCFAGVGINGHIAFNEPPYPPGTRDPEFFERGSRVVQLSRETITINSNTALAGAWEAVPTRAVTVGMRHIMRSRSLRVFLNRPWQRAPARKMLYGPITESFPASAIQRHPDGRVTMTASVAEPLDFALR
jgi:glucosamine-6-phosphate deaminase